MRVGKFVEHIRAAAELYDASLKTSGGEEGGDKVLQGLQVVRQLGYAGYLSMDALTVLDAMGVRKSDSAKKWQAQAYQFWALGLLASVLSGGWATWKLRVKSRGLDEKEAEGKVKGKVIERYVCLLVWKRQEGERGGFVGFGMFANE